MTFDRKGGLGFPEAMMAAMVVILVLTAYVGFFAADRGTETEPAFDRSLANVVTVKGGELSGDMGQELAKFMERHGYRGAMIACRVPGGIASGTLEFSVGKMDGSVFGERFLKAVEADDGRIITVLFEAAICI
ncbi:MAG: hypothetical protein LBS92_04245 [Candidatus Methanoplasma sp.]|jgi:hypothetical protein|nr:hypothetical protein [Candidatus Methanoplasma sp.]